jgi:hypothetical protein
MPPFCSSDGYSNVRIARLSRVRFPLNAGRKKPAYLDVKSVTERIDKIAVFGGVPQSKEKRMTKNINPAELPNTVDGAVERLYRVFKPYKAPQHTLDVCLFCCMDVELEIEMRQLPLRDITARHFRAYNDSAKSERQPVDELKYLLPRMLELVAAGEEIHHSVAIYLDRLGNCERADFSTAEHEAIAAFALAYFASTLRQYPWLSAKDYPEKDAFDVLLMLEIGGVDIQPLFGHWLNDETSAATLHYVYCGFYNFWQSRCIQDAFAIKRPQYLEMLWAWLMDERHRRVFAHRILELDMDAIEQVPMCSYGNFITPKEMAAQVFDWITD